MSRETILRLSFVVVLGGTAFFGGFTLTASPASPAFVELALHTSSAPPAAWGIPTSEVAGRQFVLEADGQIWVEKGVRYDRAAAHIDARSPEGQAILRSTPGLDALLEDGARVVILDDTATLVELSAGRS